MRSFLVLVFAFPVALSTAAAQDTLPTPSRWTLSAGPEWAPSTNMWGLRLRAEYDLIKPGSPLSLRFEGAGRWGPTQNYSFRYSLLDNGSGGGWDQNTDLMVGFNASLTPLPHARIAPYVTFGVYGQQSWRHGSRFVFQSSTPPSVYSYSGSNGAIIGTVGLGLRARLGGHTFQLEIRHLQGQHSFSLGTRLPF
jgi:hypothetical protein